MPPTRKASDKQEEKKKKKKEKNFRENWITFLFLLLTHLADFCLEKTGFLNLAGKPTK